MKELGRDLWKDFRPCYIRAFKDAADYAKDEGKTVKGTKNAKQDDYVSKGEFLFFVAYTCIYACMFDAFSKIDGGGAGRDAGDDKRLELAEFLKGYKGVSLHGFVALQGLESTKQATAAFAQMDDNNGGVVLLDEWCAFLKRGEVQAGTQVGKLLALEDSGGVGKPDPTGPV